MAKPGYIIASMKINDVDAYRAGYMTLAAEAVRAAGGVYLARGGRTERLEGDWQPDRVGLLRFPSFDAAKAFYDGERYRAARATRAGLTEYFNLLLVEGADDAADPA